MWIIEGRGEKIANQWAAGVEALAGSDGGNARFMRSTTRYNKHPLYLVGPWNLGQRFLMHGFFTEHVHARLEAIRRPSRCSSP